MIKAIVHADREWGIGKNGDMMFSLPKDMKFFRETTMSHTVVMGGNTLRSFPGQKPLKNRVNIVLSRGQVRDDCIIVRSYDELKKGHIADHRSLDEVVGWLLDLDHIPSFCTACYREGRTGDRFMSLLKSGQISNCCLPNALITLKEYLKDYASPATRAKGEAMIERLLQGVPNERIRSRAGEYLDRIDRGERDLRF